MTDKTLFVGWQTHSGKFRIYSKGLAMLGVEKTHWAKNLGRDLKKKSADILVQFLMFIFSLFIMAPATFFLIHYPSEIATLRKEAYDFDSAKKKFWQTLEEVKAMADVQKSGWLSRDQNDKELKVILNRVLSPDPRTDRLDMGIAIDHILWCDKALSQLIEERGKIKGYTFQEETHKSLQTQLVRYYDAIVLLIKQLDDISSGWNRYSYDERMRRIEQLKTSSEEAIETSNALYSIMDQGIARAIEKNEEMRKKSEHLKERLNNLNNKKLYAVLALTVAFLLLSTSLIWLIWKLKSRRKTNEPTYVGK